MRSAGLTANLGRLLLVGATMAVGCAQPPPDTGATVGDTPSSGAERPEPAASEAPATTSTASPKATVPPTASAPVREDVRVFVDGVAYTCGSASFRGEWECTSGSATVYCSGVGEPSECSQLWYPDELSAYYLVDFQGGSHLCDRISAACMRYDGGPIPSFAYPDAWCDSAVCSYYDPAEWFEVRIDFTTHLCTSPMLAGYQQYDCYRSIDGRPPSVLLEPDAYCSGPEFNLDCSTDWYPDELDRYELINYGGSSYVCEPAFGGSYGDYDCGRYNGGDPAFVYWKDLKCTNYATGFECSDDYYPSELEGLYFATIDYGDYVCRDTYQGSECWSYWGGNPGSATWGSPDYYCNAWGCDPYSYP
jgi:hypothetical protein